MFKDGNIKPLSKQTLYYDLWKLIQKETHFTNRQMFCHFPDVYNMMKKEELTNVEISVAKSFRFTKYRKRIMR